MAELAFDHKGEWRLELEADGSVFLRRCGGPLHHFGRVMNAETSMVSGWRARVPAPRFAAMVASLAEAGFPAIDGFHLVPDEHASSLTLRGESILVVHRAIQALLPLDRVVTELTAIAATMSANAPTDRLPNPDREGWSRVAGDQRRPGLEPPEPAPGAAARVQSAVDAFYATSLDDHLARVASRPRPPPPGVAPPPPITNTLQTFTSKATGEPAAAIGLRLTPELGGAELELVGFPPVGRVTVRVSERDLPMVHRQLTSGDARALYALDGELVPFFCPQCNACYAAKEWTIYETSPTRVEGTCPSGHRRRVRSD